jgi:hypothetical protein
MRKLTSYIIILAILLLAMPVSPVAASSPPIDVVINVDIDYSEYPYAGPFTASGPAVDEGLICESGNTVNIRHSNTGWQSWRAYSFHVWKEFTCADGSGTFIVKIEGRWEEVGGSGTWMILDGTEEYANLHGTGEADSFFIEPWFGLDIYQGEMHSE